jgi:hypothetical protein
MTVPDYTLKIQTTAQPARVLVERSVEADDDAAGIQATAALAASLKHERRLLDQPPEVVDGPPEPVEVLLLDQDGNELTKVSVPVAG